MKKLLLPIFITISVIFGSCRGFKTAEESDGEDSLAIDTTRTFQIDSLRVVNTTDSCISIENCIQYLKGEGMPIDSINLTIAAIATGAGRGTALTDALQHLTDSLFADYSSEKAEYTGFDNSPVPADTYTFDMKGCFLDGQGKPIKVSNGEGVSKVSNSSISTKVLVVKDAGIISYRLESYVFTGGAHGGCEFTFLNFNTRNGHLMSPWDVLDKRQESKILDLMLQQLLRDNDCKTRDELINKTGILEMGDLTVTSNFLITDKGLVFHFGQYELACYAAGMQEIDLSWESLEQNGCLLGK